MTLFTDIRYVSARQKLQGDKTVDLFEAIRERRSARVFKPDPVPRDTIEEVIKLATQAPSAMNLQPWEFYIAIGEEKERLSRTLIKAYREKQFSCGPGTSTPLPKIYSQRGGASLNFMKPILEKMGTNFDQFINEGSCNFYGAPIAAIICLDDLFPNSRMVDIGITLGYLVLSAHGLGLNTCPIGLIAAYEDEIKDVLNIPDSKRVIIGVALGYSDFNHPINKYKSARGALDEFVKWID